MITKQQAKLFYDKLKCKVYPPEGKVDFAQVKMSPKLVSSYMDINEKEAEEYCKAIVEHKLSEWEGELMVI